jgi:plastocyanin
MALVRFVIVLGMLSTLPLAEVSSQAEDVLARLELLRAGTQKEPNHASSNVVIWLTPAPAVTRTSVDTVPGPGHFRMEQKNKGFNPHLLVVPLGSTVEFPNLDPFFHNVFSQFNGKRFDLGLYETGSTRVVRFDHEGISYLFCNIHSQMAAVIVTLRTPYFAVATRGGVIELHNVPDGDYEMHVWAEGGDAKQLDALSRRVHIGSSQRDLGSIQVYVTGTLPAHKNKFGEDYKPDPDQTY